MTRSLRALLLVIVAVTVAICQADPQWVSIGEARKHLRRSVSPVLPSLPVTQNPVGTVSLQITISPHGEVEAMKKLSGDPLLVPPVEAAVRQWTYRPFLRNGRPIAVTAQVDWTFPPLTYSQGQTQAMHDYEPAFDRCYRMVHARQLPEAESVCRQAVTLSDQLPPHYLLERSIARAMLGNALVLDKHVQQSIPFYQEALAIDQKALNNQNDADFATDHINLGRAYALLGELSKADLLYQRGVEIYRAAIINLPSMKANYVSRLRQALREYATVKLRAGDFRQAVELEEQAQSLR